MCYKYDNRLSVVMHSWYYATLTNNSGKHALVGNMSLSQTIIEKINIYLAIDIFVVIDHCNFFANIPLPINDIFFERYE